MSAKNVNKTKYIRTAAIIALGGNIGLALLQIIFGLISNSNALVGNGIDSSADVLISIVTLFIVKVISKPADAKHPWGHGRAETVATAFLSFIIFFAGAQLIISSITSLISGDQTTTPSSLALVISIISIIGKLLLAWSQHTLGKRADSAMIKANAKNMASDVMVSVGVLIGLVISIVIDSAHADTIIALLIGAWIIKTAIGIFLEVNVELMDGNSNMAKYQVIVDSVNATNGAFNPHRARMRSIAGFWDINFDIDVDPNCTVKQAHKIMMQVEREIRKRLENVYDIVIHVEPKGDDEKEVFGLSEDEMSNQKENDD